MFRYAHTNMIARDHKKLIAFYKAVFHCRSIGETRPAPLLREGKNELIVFETEGKTAGALWLEDCPVYVEYE